MDIDKFIRKVPLVFCIINLEATIGRNTLSSAADAANGWSLLTIGAELG